MTKERLVAFTDAILAIIMTILVLELAKPSEPTWAALWELKFNLLAYAVSFLWLGAMWINLHNIWHDVTTINNKVLWANIAMLFFASLIPYVTSFASDYFHEVMAQMLYWVVVILVSLSNVLLGAVLEKANGYGGVHLAVFGKAMYLDLAIKVLGLLLCIFVYPPLAMISVIIAGVIPVTIINEPYRFTNNKEETK